MENERLVAGKNEGPSRELSALEVSCAIVDGINTYVGELVAAGVIDESKLDDGLDTPLYAAKYQVANRFALKWVSEMKMDRDA